MKFTEEDRNKNKAKFKFQGYSSRLQRWFDIYFYLIEVNFSTHKPELYMKLFRSHDNTQDSNTFKLFQVPIGNSKCVDVFKFHSDASMLNYCQKLLNGCCFSSLAYAFSSIKQTNSFNAISFCMEESLKIKIGNRIDFANAILKNEKNLKVNQECIIA